MIRIPNEPEVFYHGPVKPVVYWRGTRIPMSEQSQASILALRAADSIVATKGDDEKDALMRYYDLAWLRWLRSNPAPTSPAISPSDVPTQPSEEDEQNFDED